MLNILFPKRPLSAGMNGVTLLFLVPLVLYTLWNTAALLFPEPEPLYRWIAYGILSAVHLYASASLMYCVWPLLRRITPGNAAAVRRMIPLAIPVFNLFWLIAGILEPARTRGALPENAERYVRLSSILLTALVLLGICGMILPDFRAMQILFTLLLCRTLYLSIRNSAVSQQETGSPALSIVLLSLLCFLYGMQLSTAILSDRKTAALQREIAGQAGALSYDTEEVDRQYRKRCPVTNPEFDRLIRNPKPGDDLFEQYPDLTLRLPSGLDQVMKTPASAGTSEQLFAAHASLLRKIDEWSALPALGISAGSCRPTMNERNVFLNWARLHMLRAELAVARGDRSAALHYWTLLQNVRDFIRSIPDQPSDFTASTVEAMRLKLFHDMKTKFSFTPAELHEFRSGFASDLKNYETGRKIILFRETLSCYPPRKVSLKTILSTPYSGSGARKERMDLHAVLAYMKTPGTLPAPLHDPTLSALIRQMRGKRAENLGKLSDAVK